MLSRWLQWNKQAKKWLWVITLIGVVAALPLGFTRMEMEKGSNTIEYVYDYRDIVEVADVQPRAKTFIDEQLALLKEAGVTTMAVYESSMKELLQAGRLNYYNSRDAALLQSKVDEPGQNFTYILFAGEEEEQKIAPIVIEGLERAGVTYRPWSFDGRNGLVAEISTSGIALLTLDFDPMSLDAIHEAGFKLLPRYSDRVAYDSIKLDEALANLSENYNVDRLLFDGEKAKGASDQAALKSLDSFGELLNKYNIGIATIENLKKPQQGINKLAFLTNYNVVRLYSLSPQDAAQMDPKAISDRFQLAAKDRNIRMFFLNTSVAGNSEQGILTHSIEKLAETLKGPGGVVAALTEAGFPSGDVEPFQYERTSWMKPLRGVVAIGAIAIIALLIGAFVPGVLIPVFGIGLVGSAGLYVLNSSVMEQALALGAAISAPTLGLIWVMNRIRSRTVGNRRVVGGEEWKTTERSADGTPIAAEGTKWLFHGHALGKRFGTAINWFIAATLISLTAVPLVFGLLHNITYNLVLEQFRGVSMLHLAPIGLVAVYVLLYNGQSTLHTVRQLLSRPITLTWVIVAAVIGGIGFYYLSRTGNGGSVSSIELVIRNVLESTFGVRPRFKEFLLAHPLLLLGLFLSLRYRAAWVLIIVGSIGQLSMVDTFAHLHTPLYISIIRVLLGLGTGIIFGCLLILAWQLVEGALRKWVPAARKYIG